VLLVSVARATAKVMALDFWASWASPCDHMNQLFDSLAQKYNNVAFAKVGRNF